LIVSGGTQQQMWDYLEMCESEFYAAGFEAVAKPSSVNGLKKFAAQEKGIPFHVYGALTYNETLERLKLTDTFEPIREGEKIKAVYLREPNPFHSHVMSAAYGCPADWKIEQWIDYETQCEKVFLSPVRDLLTVVGWTVRHEASLFD